MNANTNESVNTPTTKLLGKPVAGMREADDKAVAAPIERLGEVLFDARPRAPTSPGIAKATARRGGGRRPPEPAPSATARAAGTSHSLARRTSRERSDDWSTIDLHSDLHGSFIQFYRIWARASCTSRIQMMGSM